MSNQTGYSHSTAFFRTVLAALCLLCCCRLAMAAPLLPEKTLPYSLAGHLEHLVDPAGSLTLRELLAGGSGVRFTPLPGFVNHGFTTSASWTRFTYIPPKGSPDLFLRLTPSFVDEVTVYVQVGSSPVDPASYRRYDLGDHYPATAGRIVHPDMVAPVPSDDGVPRRVYIRVKSSGAHILQGWLHQEDDFIGWTADRTYRMGLFVGFILAEILAVALLAFLWRDGVLGYLALFGVIYICRKMGIEGDMFVLWPAGAHLVNDYLTGWGIGLGLCVYSLFIMRLFKTGSRRSWVHRYLQLNVIIGVAAALAIPLGWYGRLAPLAFAAYLVMAVIAPLLAYRHRRDDPVGGWIFVALSLGLIFGTPRIFAALGVAPGSWATSRSVYYGMALQTIVVTLVLFKRLEASREEALSASRRNEAAALELAREMTEELREQAALLSQEVESRRQAQELLLDQRSLLETLNLNLEDRVAEEVGKNRAKERALMQSEKLASIGQLAAGVAHEINNPVCYIISNLDLLTQYTDQIVRYDLLLQGHCRELSPSTRELIKKERELLDMEYILTSGVALVAESLEGAERVSKIVRDLKTFSRVGVEERELTDLNRCLESALTIVNNELKYVATVRKEYGDLPELLCNPGQLSQVFLNLLVNAGHAIVGRGEIVLRSWCDEEFVHVSVSDTGAGIPEEIRCRLFEPFFTTKEVGVGTGLGLSISHEIMKKHEGKLLVESEVGVGSTFTVSLPRTPKEVV